MTGNSILLDTNIVIELFKGNMHLLNILGSKTFIYLPFAVLGELFLGAYKSANPDKHLNQINSFVKECIVINANEETANQYAIIKSQLFKKGKPIPENDIWIAAIANQHGLELYTKDNHFKEVDNLSVIWL